MSQVTLEHALSEGARFESAGQLDHADAIYRAIVEQIPTCDAAMARLAFLAHRKGRGDEAADWLRRAVDANPSSANHLGNLGTVLAGKGQFEQAVEFFARAVKLEPQASQLWVNFGNVLIEIRQWERAIGAYQAAVRLDPNNPEAHFSLGNTLWEMGRNREAVEAQRRALALRPNFAEAWLSLGSALRNDGRMDESMAAFTRARLQLRPDLGEAYTGMAAVHQMAGRLKEAVGCYRRAAEMTGRSGVTDILLVNLHLDPDYDAMSLYQEHAAWNQRFARPLAREIPAHPNDPSPDRRLRVGYVSAYLSGRPVGRFLTPLLTHHDHAALEIICYSDARTSDSTTDALRARADLWRDTAAMDEAQLAQVIHDDRIDILVDLGMHARGNRMLTFARKPAPVQLTYLAYCSTTGLETIDYRISDPFLDPTDADQPFYSEKTVRLPSYWCYPEPQDAPPVSELPAARNSFVTFGCLNDFSKVTNLSLDMWGRIMRDTPHSRLVIHSLEGSHRARVIEGLGAYGVDADRVRFVAIQPMPDYFATYQQIDIALDPTPWCGGTTTCDALWMGVPVVTLAWKTAISRGGASILGQLGLSQWVARDPEDYVLIASDRAADLNRLAKIRSTLREQMQSSRLMDGPSFAREFEAALRKMWRKWCEENLTK